MINSVVLVGRLTRDPELRRTSSGTAVASFTVAVDNLTKDANGNKTSSFIPCTAWNSSADFISKYAHKGSLVGVTGRLNQRSYDSKDGRKVQVVEVVASQVQLLEPKAAGNNNAVANEDDRSFEAPEADNNINDISLDDDLPF